MIRGQCSVVKIILISWSIFLLSCTSKSSHEETHHLVQAITYLKSHHFEKAKIECEKALTKNPSNPYAYYFLGASYYFQSDLDNAHFKYLHAINLDKNFIYPYIELARVNYEQGKEHEADMYLNDAEEILLKKSFIKNQSLDYRVIDNDQDIEFEVYMLHAKISLNLEEIQNAEKYVQKALHTQEKNSSNSTAAKNLLASIFIIENNPSEALTVISTIQTKDESIETTREIIKEIIGGTVDSLAFKYYYFGQHKIIKDQKAALELLERASAISPFFTENNYMLVTVYLNNDLYEKAQDMCNKMIQHNALDIRFRQVLAGIYEKQMKFSDAQIIFKSIARIQTQQKQSTEETINSIKKIDNKKIVKQKIDAYITSLQKRHFFDLYNMQSNFSKEQINEIVFEKKIKEHWPHQIVLYLINEIEYIDETHMLVKAMLHEEHEKKIVIIKKYFILVQEKDSWFFLAPEDQTIQQIYLDERKDLKKKLVSTLRYN